MSLDVVLLSLLSHSFLSVPSLSLSLTPFNFLFSHSLSQAKAEMELVKERKAEGDLALTPLLPSPPPLTDAKAKTYSLSLTSSSLSSLQILTVCSVISLAGRSFFLPLQSKVQLPLISLRTLCSYLSLLSSLSSPFSLSLCPLP